MMGVGGVQANVGEGDNKVAVARSLGEEKNEKNVRGGRGVWVGLMQEEGSDTISSYLCRRREGRRM